MNEEMNETGINPEEKQIENLEKDEMAKKADKMKEKIESTAASCAEVIVKDFEKSGVHVTPEMKEKINKNVTSTIMLALLIPMFM